MLFLHAAIISGTLSDLSCRNTIWQSLSPPFKHGSMPMPHSSLQRRIPGCPQGVDPSETALRKFLIAGWVTEVKPGEHSIADVRHRHLGSPAVEDRIGVSAMLQHPVDHAAADVVRI